MLFISLHAESAVNSILGKILNTCICGTYGFEVKTKMKVLNLENFSVLQIIDCVIEGEDGALCYRVIRRNCQSEKY